MPPMVKLSEIGRAPLAVLQSPALSWPVFVPLLLVFVYYATSLFWQITYPAGFVAGVLPPAGAERVERKAAARAWNWFADTSPVKRAPPPVKHSPLEGRLVGVIAMGEKRGMAMIELKKKKAAIFRVGDEVEEGLVLKVVQSDRVTLQRGEQSEVLELQRATKGSKRREPPAPKPAPAPVAEKPPAPAPAPRPQNRDEYKKALKERPIRLMSMVNFKRVDTDNGPGFSLTPKTDEDLELFQSFGLEPGDVLLSANGAGAMDLPSSPKLWKSLVRAESYTLRVSRGGVEEQIVID